MLIKVKNVPYTNKLIGLSLFCGMLAFCVKSIGVPLTSYLFLFLFWIPAVFILFSLEKKIRFQVLFLFSLGLLFLFASLKSGKPVSTFKESFTTNINVLSMLIAVSFLSLVDYAKGGGKPPTGRLGVALSWLVTHTLGSVINMSSAFLVGDRLLVKNSIKSANILTITRALTSAGFWSPFFASMAVALSYAPNANYLALLLFGLPLAIISMLVNLADISRKKGISKLAGYPIHVSNLALPVVFAFLILLSHYTFASNLSILALITFLAPILSVTLLFIRSPSSSFELLKGHIFNRLPKMGNEINLFISAGFMSFCLNSLLKNNELELLRSLGTFSFFEACLLYSGIVITSIVGLHPIITISVLFPMLEPHSTNHTLLAFVSVCSWSIGTCVGPFSGINLALRGRYGVDTFAIMKSNIPYAVYMSAFIFIAFYYISQHLGLN